MESFDQFKGVMGLRARNLKHRGQLITNEKDRVHMHFKDGDEVCCDLESEDMWLKCKVDYQSTFMREWNASFELRLKQDQLFYELKKMVQKVVIDFWNAGINSSLLYKRNITILKNLQIHIKSGK